MPTKPDDLLEAQLEELRRMYDGVSEIYTQTRTKIFAFMSGGLAFLAFYFGSQTLELPTANYGKIIYLLSLTVEIVALAILFIATQPVSWIIPPETADLKKNSFKSKNSFLTYMIEQYLDAIKNNGSKCEEKRMES
jgi:hypothetical protein